MKNAKSFLFAGILVLMMSAVLSAAESNVVVLYDSVGEGGSEHRGDGFPMPVGYPYTDSYGYTYNPNGWIQGALNGTLDPELTGCPPHNVYHTMFEWYFQRTQSIKADQLANAQQRRDWSAYQYLRFDAYSTNNVAVVGVRVKDSRVSTSVGYLGNFTPLATFRIPVNQWVTCNFPLKALADTGELDLTKMQGFHMQSNGFEGPCSLQVRNVRLVGSGTPTYPLLEMEEAIAPLGRVVVNTAPPVRDPVKMARNLVVTTDLGPVTIALGRVTLGGEGITYVQNNRRGMVAYDNDRLALIARTSTYYDGSNWSAILLQSNADVLGGLVAFGSFDGGATWGGITRGETRPTRLNSWYGRASASSSLSNGDLYMIGTENCTNYASLIDGYFRRLAFTGDGWVADRFGLLDQMYKCPVWSYAVTLWNGRLWATRGDGFGSPYAGFRARYSDDDGRTWMPCKDADIAGNTTNPRPWYQAGVDPVPSKVILFPGDSVPGAILVPYGNGVASIDPYGRYLKIHDGSQWGALQSIASWGTSGQSYTDISATCIDNDHIFMAKGGRINFDNSSEALTDLVVTHSKAGGSWTSAQLETGNITDAILTSAGSFVYCFYSQKSGSNYLVKYRRWNNGTWEAAVQVASETVRINRVGAPMNCPGSYACVMWDAAGGSFLKFAKVATGVAGTETGWTGCEKGNRALVGGADALLGISPNPFSGNAVIQYRVNGKTPVSITVYNVNGQRVVTLVNGKPSAGAHSIVLTAKNMVPGIYFVKMASGNNQFVRKAILTR
ncbi:MAG: T9SS type A sorting domain-containing protein [Fibrobacterota bacterium]